MWEECLPIGRELAPSEGSGERPEQKPQPCLRRQTELARRVEVEEFVKLT